MDEQHILKRLEYIENKLQAIEDRLYRDMADQWTTISEISAKVVKREKKVNKK